MVMVIVNVFVWLFGTFSFGYLARFRLVIWHVFVWLFGNCRGTTFQP